MKGWIAVAACLIIIIVGAQFISIFVVQPIGAVPEGRTIIITRLTNVNFIDSADAICARKMGGVSLLCRGAMLGRVSQEANVLVRLPYSSFLYGISTGGAKYDR